MTASLGRWHLALWLVMTGSGVAQQKPPEDVVIRSTTRLVEINVIAQDRSGRYLADLRKEDFTVLDNGRPQPVAIFAANTAPPASSAPAPAANTFSNHVDRRAGYAVLLLDWLNTDFGDRAQARQQVLKMLRQIDDPEHIAIYVLDQGLRVIHEFGGGKTALERKIGTARGSPEGAPGASSPYDASLRGISSDLFSAPRPRSLGNSRANIELQILQLDTRIRDTLAALDAIGRHLAGVDGRKSLIWLTAGIPTSIDGMVIRGASTGERTYTTEIEGAIRRLSNADVAVYPIDARGLSVSRYAFINIQTMQTFAQRTGGKAYVNRNDIDVALGAALNDQRISYTLGFYASGDQSSDAPHRIHVKIARPGVNLRYREAYFANDAPPAANEILRSPVDATSLPVSVHTSRRSGDLDAVVILDPTTVSLSQDQGKWHGKIEIVPRFVAADGAFVGTSAVHTIQLDILPGTYQVALQEGLRLQLSLAIPPTAERVRFFVRDDISRTMGSVTVALDKIQ